MKTFSLTTAGIAAVTVAALVTAGLVGAQAASATTTASAAAASTTAASTSVTAAHQITVTASNSATLAKGAATAAASTSAKAAATYADKAAWVTAATKTYALRLAASTKAQLDMKKVVASRASAATKSRAKASAAAQLRAVASAKTSLDSAKTAATKSKAAAAVAAAASKAAAARAATATAALAAAQAAEKAAATTAALPVLASTLIPESAAVNTTSIDTAVPTGNVTTNGRTWVQSYKEDFDTPAALGTVLTKYPGMAAYDGFTDTSGQGLYAPDKVLSVADGNLDFHLHSENGQPLVAAVMPDDYAPHTTGRVSIRYKTTAATGYKFVGMFWPSSDDWNDGEIDWPEADLAATPRPASAVPGTYSAGRMNFMPATEAFASSDSSAYHIATTEWDTHAVRYYWDGRLVSTVTNAVPTKPMRVTLQAETFLGQGTVPKDTSGHLDIDWISIWN